MRSIMPSTPGRSRISPICRWERAPIDSFIGAPEMIGRGHGSAYLRLLAQRLVADGAPLVAIDPDAANLRARRAYAKAGFRGDAIIETGEGPVVLMIFEG